jgi:hypothetical protein
VGASYLEIEDIAAPLYTIAGASAQACPEEVKKLKEKLMLKMSY